MKKTIFIIICIFTLSCNDKLPEQEVRFRINGGTEIIKTGSDITTNWTLPAGQNQFVVNAGLVDTTKIQFKLYPIALGVLYGITPTLHNGEVTYYSSTGIPYTLVLGTFRVDELSTEDPKNLRGVFDFEVRNGTDTIEITNGSFLLNQF